MKKSALALVALALSGSVLAQQVKPEDQMLTRQGGYKFMAWNMGKIKAQVDGPADKFDKARVLNAALAIKGIANSGMGELFGPGTDKPVGSVKTRAKPEVFDPRMAEERGRIARNYIEQVNKLAEVAAAGDPKAIAAQFGATAKACDACHDKFRADAEKKS
jgi:cytochrome c556